MPTIISGSTGIDKVQPSTRAASNALFKVSATAVFTKTSAGVASIKAGTRVTVAGNIVAYTSDTNITMPTLTAGTDYAVWVKDDATIQATIDFTTSPSDGNWLKIGGFHYAPGGNAAGQAGGNTTAQINEYSFWDLNFKPSAPDPRGMTLVADSFWSDIYFLGVDHQTNGSSKYNVTIADGSSPPKVPSKFGGNGTTAYTTLTRYEGAEVAQSFGKRLPSYEEFAALAYGTTEATSSGGTDVPTTGISGTGATSVWNIFTSRWGVVQSSGCLWIWGFQLGGGAAAAATVANTTGRGSTYQIENASLFGGDWANSTASGSRCSTWNIAVSFSANSISVRCVCDHLILV